MKVAIDISAMHRFSVGRGIGMYAKSLIQSLATTFVDDKFILVTDGNIPTDVDVIHYPYFDLFFSTLPYGSNANKVVVTVHDIIPLLYPDHYIPGLRGSIRFMYQRYKLNRVSKIVTDSFCSRGDIIDHFSIRPSKVSAIHLAANPDYKPIPRSLVSQKLDDYHITKPYYLYVGDINYNKNLSGLLEVFSRIHSDTMLVLVSKALSQNIPEALALRKRIHEPDLSEKVIILTDVPSLPEIDLPALYSGAHWYIQPSLYEGFGLPILEAMQCGCPVLSSNGGSLKEVVSNAGITFDPTNQDDFLRAFKVVDQATELDRKAWISKGKSHAKTFTWKKTAEQTYAVYSN